MTLEQYIAQLKADAGNSPIVRAVIADQNVSLKFRRALQMALPGDAGLMAERGPAPRSMPYQMPGDPYSGGGR